MDRRLFALICTAGLVGAGVPGLANAQTQQVPPQAVWQLDWRSPFCQLSTGDLKTLGLGIWAVPGSPGVELYFIGSGARVPKLPDASDAVVQLAPAGGALKARVGWRGPYWTGVLKLGIDDEKALDEIRQANALQVQEADKTLAMQVPGASKAISALKDCLDSHLKDWGIDGAALAALKAWPHVQPKSWITADNYPLDALNANASGIVVVRLTTDPSGRVTNCTVVQNSGTKSMEQATCGAALKRAHYTPALGSDGRPTSATFITYSEFKVFES